jgi:mRNA interferase MazF
MELVERFDVFLVKLDPTIGSEIHKTRPCLVISPDEINSNLATVIVAPMTTSGKKYPSRIPVSFDDKDGFVALDRFRVRASGCP